jgi:hypothetical protein
MNRKIIVAAADLHSNSRYGLLNPFTALTEQMTGAKYEPGLWENQKILWYKSWYPGWKDIVTWAGKDEIDLFLMGDLVQGYKHPSHWVSVDQNDEIKIAVSALHPVCQIPNLRRVQAVIGTEAHAGLQGSTEKTVIDLLAAKNPDKNIGISLQNTVTVDGLVFDLAHHGPPPGRRKWLEGNEARLYLRSAMMNEIIKHQKPPDIYIRAHHHVPIIETMHINGFTSTIYLLPSLCTMDYHATKATQSQPYVTVGFRAQEITDGVVTGEREYYYTLDMRSRLTW